MSISRTLKDKLLRNTGFFEGDKGYSTVTGNFDNQGISFGIIQFNFGQGTLQPLLKEYINDYEAEFKEIFGNKASEVKNVVFNYSKSKQIQWGESITNRYGHLISEWENLFEEMGADKDNQRLQRKYAKDYINRALYLADKFEVETTQGLAFLFDQAVQEWSFKSGISTIQDDVEEYANKYFRIYKERMPDFERLGIILEYVKSDDGKERRKAIRLGEGNVHGKDYDISDFDLSYDDKF